EREASAAGPVPSVWQWSAALQLGGWLPAQPPFSQASAGVQASPSLQAVPSAFAGFEHVPLAGSQVPAMWHWSEAEQTTALPPVHTPLSQVSVWVQRSPSSQAVPSGWSLSDGQAALVSQQLSASSWSSAAGRTA